MTRLVCTSDYQYDILTSESGPPNLQENLTFKIVENSLNVPIDLSQDPAAFPEPTTYTWARNGAPLSGPPPTLTYSSVTFLLVSRNDAGNYAVSATNFDLNNNTVVGSDVGSFSLTVICMFACLVHTYTLIVQN